MTQRAGNVIVGGPVNFYFDSPRTGLAGSLVQSISAVPNLLTFKNQGWYAAGSVYETWTSVTAPDSNPPSGHTLTGISFVVFDQTA